MSKVAIVTGGGRGIGRGCAHELARQGLDIVLVDLIEEDLARTRTEIEAMGRTGRIDVLVNNAGRSNDRGILEIDEEAFDRTIAINLKGAFNWTHAVAPHMMERQTGRIVMMSSLNAYSGGVTSAVSKFSYTAAKAGLLGMTRALAKELAPHVLVNAVCPGVIETERGNAMIHARKDELVAGIALGRTGTPADVAQAVAFLALSEPCFVTGQDIVVDGMQWIA
ncbi:SDR family oxidoreductase [Kaustia mangrovi]|uniref:SDR family oxidoreductase n=1 Tax=Kaustia mangrovi TaxID=2593653 RepID=A0A7S8HC89_9HYPH|nr:SDR family NAD(P)-dependent oxidoreductase [Kaustia mangrovi]QPC42988.1 SDR family oxidoreductase [Kaustia mangrovi]